VAAILDATMNWLSHSVRCGLAATVILALGHSLVPGGWGGVFTFFSRTTAPIADWAGSLVSLPIWVLGLVFAVLLTALGVAGYVASTRFRTRAPGKAPLTKAEIFGIRWRWDYREGDVHDLTSYCPKCDRQVRPTEETRHGFLHLISYQCACGHWRSKSFQCSRTEIIKRVCRTIQKHAQT
jgi:hypothetical protein